MRFGLEEHIFIRLNEVFEANSKVDKALIFGSRAKGNYRPDSDIDIAIKGADITLDDILKMQVAFEEKGIKFKIDLVYCDTIQEKGLIEHIDRVGIEIYSKWKKYKLQEISDVQTGPFGSQLKNEQYIKGGTPVVTVEHIQDFRIIDFDYPSVTSTDKERLSKYLLNYGDIIFTRVGSVDLSAYVKRHQDGWMFSSRMLRVRPNKSIADPRFLSYYFQQAKFREHILNISVGATMPSINTDILKGIKVCLPPIPEQTLIAEILSSLDDKIDLLHRQNKTLEQLAETLFRKWFVVEADESWEEDVLENYISFDPREKIDRNKAYQFFEMKCLSNVDMNISDGVYRIVSSASSFRNFDTLLAKITPCLENGKTGFVMHLGDDEVARGSTEFIVMRSKGLVSPYWIYCLARDSDFREKAIQSMTGTSGRQRVQIDLLKNITVKVDAERMKKFHDTVSPFFLKIKSNQTQIKTLTKLRDALLPKLVNGEVRVQMN